MTSKKIWLTLFILSLVVFVQAQSPADLVGTWAGTATAEGETNDLTVVLSMKDGTLVGHMSDATGAMAENPLAEITFKDGVLDFDVAFDNAGGTMIIKFQMKVDGDSMKGTFEFFEMGLTGTWEAERQRSFILAHSGSGKGDEIPWGVANKP